MNNNRRRSRHAHILTLFHDGGEDEPAFSTISERSSKFEFKFFDSSAQFGLQFERLLELSSNRIITNG